MKTYSFTSVMILELVFYFLLIYAQQIIQRPKFEPGLIIIGRP